LGFVCGYEVFLEFLKWSF